MPASTANWLADNLCLHFTAVTKLMQLAEAEASGIQWKVGDGADPLRLEGKWTRNRNF